MFGIQYFVGGTQRSLWSQQIHMLAPAIAFGIAWFVGRSQYRLYVRPHLIARPPKSEGAAARCRVCGGDLPTSHKGPFIPCTYCGAKSLLSKQLATNRKLLLEQEQHYYASRAQGAINPLNKVANSSAKATTIVFAVVMMLLYAGYFLVLV